MDLDSITKWIRGEWAVIAQAPITFVASILVIAFVIWKLVQREFSTRLANAASTTDLYKTKLDRFETERTLTIATADHVHREEINDTTSARQQIATQSPPPAPTEKVYVRDDITPDKLVEIFQGRTALQARHMVQDEIGKWIKISGPVIQVSKLTEKLVSLSLPIGQLRAVNCFFEGDLERLLSVSMGDQVSIDGRISDITTLWISLDDCQLTTI